MKIMTVRDKFRCAALESGELPLFFEAKKVAYTDPDNPDIAHKRDKVLPAMQAEGLPYFEGIFSDPRNTAFILLNDRNDIVGSANILLNETGSKAEFQAHHILSALRGQRLIDLFYTAAEQHLRQHTQCQKITLWTTPENTSSQKAAIRNGYLRNGTNQRNCFIFEKHLGQ